MITLIVAASENNVIGRDGNLPWKLPDDLKHFKQVTMGKPVVMGRKTWESLRRPLPGRQNVVITRQRDYSAEGCDVVSYPAAALQATSATDDIMIIGGGRVYEQFMRRAGRIYLTRVHTTIEGDAYFPKLDDEWERVSDEHHAADDRHEYGFTFEVWERGKRD
ncbi:MAG: dihydrofolate reductase [Woeseiaceae bacterium]|nr:dihydrofolate reductase [Woeseiaceae bacterium]